jgi:hypothetical protein
MSIIIEPKADSIAFYEENKETLSKLENQGILKDHGFRKRNKNKGTYQIYQDHEMGKKDARSAPFYLSNKSTHLCSPS